MFSALPALWADSVSEPLARTAQPPDFPPKPIVLLTDSERSSPQIAVAATSMYLIDSTNTASIDNIRKRFPKEGIASKGQINFGVSPFVFWFAFSLHNQDSVPLSRLLVFEDYFLEEIDTYVFSDDSLRTRLRGGCIVPFGEREILNRFTAHRLYIKPYETMTFFVRVKCRLTMSVPTYLWSEAAFVYEDSLNQITVWLYYGIVLGLFAYNMFICWTLRSMTYLLYLVYMLHISAFLFWGSNGLGYQFFTISVETSFRLIIYLGIMSIALVSILTIAFLDLPNVLPRWNTVIRSSAAAMVLLALSAWVLPIQLVQDIGNPATGALALLCAMVAVRAIWLNSLPARYFAAGWLVFLAATILFVLQDAGLIEWAFIGHYGAQVGSALEMILFSIALASRINVLEQERQQAREQLLVTSQALVQNLQESEKILEQKVKERTLNLQEANEQLNQQAQEIEQTNIQLQEQNTTLAKLNTEKNELLGIVSHDLKNPIGSIRSLTELLQHNIAPPEHFPYILHQIAATADRMLALVKNLLDINRLESGKMEFESVAFDIVPVVESVLAQYATHAESKEIRLTLDIATPSTLVIADEQAMVQVMDNLLSNAIKYSPQGKNVWIRMKNHSSGDNSNTPTTNAQITNGVLRLEVADEGPGISAEDMPKLFGKFARLSAQPTGDEHSTGLGLSIVKKLVEAMHGRVWCESELSDGIANGRPNGQTTGARFIVELPRA